MKNIFIIDNDELRSNVLAKSYYFDTITEPKNNTQLELITLDSFDINIVKEFVNKSNILLCFDKPLLLEVLDVMNTNKNKIGLDEQNNIGLYLNGKPLLRIKINKEIKNPQIMHVSLHKYRTFKNEIVTDTKLNRITNIGIGGLLVLSSIFVGTNLLKK